MDIAAITKFLAWCTLFNFVLLIYSTVMLVAFQDFVKGVHKRLFKLDDEDMVNEYFRFLANYELFIIVFNIVPYLILRFFF